MWNMDFTVPTLVLLIIIAGSFFGRKRLPIRLNTIFAGLLATDFLTMLMDFVATTMDEAGTFFPDPVLWLANYLFFGFFTARGFYFFRFTLELADPGSDRGRNRPYETLYVMEQLVLLICSLSGWIFSVHDGVYESGILYPFINIEFGAWIVLAFIITAVLRPPVQVRKSGIYLYLAILMCGVLFRALLPHVVVMNLFCLFAIQVIYLGYLNPEQYIDGITQLFNDAGWNRFLMEVGGKEDFGIIGFGIRDYVGLRQVRGNQKFSQGLHEVASWLHRTWPDIYSFYLGDGIYILASCQPHDQQSIIKAIKERFESPWIVDGGECYVGCNIMVMEPGCHGGNVDLLIATLQDVYHQLNQAKQIDMIRVDEGLIGRHVRAGEVQAILQRALAVDGLDMFLQPIISTKTGKLEGAEALCRLPDEEGGYVYPDEFIPLAANGGSTDALGHQMFRKACAFMSREDVRSSGLKWINVNVAPEQFKNPNLLSDFLRILDQYGLESSMIHLEVTEETMIDRALLHDSMARFREAGFVFAMDDFGSSYSNMIRLQQNHFSCVKIDRDFTWSYFKQKTALLPDIIKTCHDLGMRVVIEGVETREMAEGVTQIGADFIQGYYYSKPIPASEFAERYIAAPAEAEQAKAAQGSDDATCEPDEDKR